MSLAQPDGYLANPPAGSGKPVLVLHAWWGLNDTIKSLCLRLAASGFTAFAPDLYHGKVTDQIAEAEALVTALERNIAQPRADVAQAARYLQSRAGATETGIAVVGFSLGAFYALDLSAADPDTVRSVILFYGTGPVDVTRTKAAYLGHFAENDPFEARSNVDALEQGLRQAGRPVTFHHYPGTGHWFFEPDRADAYKPDAADLAWERTLEFLKQSFPA
ncbi:MAG: dienelactone hydrolase family protein [Anaerolineae bacterium]|nr:dienelactone hydrolase family protein [Anaerolineae bacterium]